MVQSPGKEAYLHFENWAKLAQSQGHFKGKTSDRDLVHLFDANVLKRHDFSAFKAEIKGLVRLKDLTKGNKRAILDKASEIYKRYQSRVQGANSPAAAGSSSAIDEVTIGRIAAQKGYLWFYKAPENTLTQCFGNFYEIPGGISYKGVSYRNSEAAFQAQKFPGREREFSHLDGDQAWRHANTLSKSMPLPARWHQGQKDQVMREIIETKFGSGTLASALRSTGSAYLIEHNPAKGRDTYWSDDHDGSGHNMLGQILMEQRGRLGGTGVVRNPGNIPYSHLR